MRIHWFGDVFPALGAFAGRGVGVFPTAIVIPAKLGVVGFGQVGEDGCFGALADLAGPPDATVVTIPECAGYRAERRFCCH